MSAPSVLWGLGLGIIDGALYSLIRDSYNIWQHKEKANGPANSMTKLWQNLILASILGGFVFPYFYFWAAYSVGSIAEIHIYRCMISLLISLFIGTVVYNDTINGFRSLGLLFTGIGLSLVLISTAYGSEKGVPLNP
jgi:MFS family permease